MVFATGFGVQAYASVGSSDVDSYNFDACQVIYVDELEALDTASEDECFKVVIENEEDFEALESFDVAAIGPGLLTVILVANWLYLGLLIQGSWHFGAVVRSCNL